MLLPAPVPASNLSSEDESPVASSKGQSGGGHLNNCVEDSPTIVMSSKQGIVAAGNIRVNKIDTHIVWNHTRIILCKYPKFFSQQIG